MRLLIFILLLVGAVLKAQATTYYVRADGSATKVNAIGPTTDATACMSLATYSASTFLAGDNVYFSDKGGGYTAVLSARSSGDVGNPITYAGAPGETPVFTVAGTPLGTGAKTNVTLSNLTVLNTVNAGGSVGVSVAAPDQNNTLSNIRVGMLNGIGFNFSGAFTNLTVSGCSVTNAIVAAFLVQGATNTSLTLSNFYAQGSERIDIRNTSGGILAANVTHTNGVSTDPALEFTACSGAITVTNAQIYNHAAFGLYINGCAGSSGLVTSCILSNVAGQGYYCNNSSGFTFTGNLVDKVTGTGSGFYFLGDCSSMVLSNNVARNNTLDGVQIAGTSHGFTLSSNSSSNNTGIGFRFVGTGAGVTNISCSGDVAIANGAEGFSALGTGYGFLFTNCIAASNLGDGMQVTDYTHDIIWTHCASYLNGTKSSTTSGDGFAAHLTNYNIFAETCLSYSNTASGFAMVGFSAGRTYNCTAWANAGNWTGVGGADQVRGGFYFNLSGVNPVSGTSWLITNCVCGLNYPRELWLNNVPGNPACPIALDYNCYWPTSAAQFASLDGGSTTISWAIYHATYESNSFNADPSFRSGTYTPLWTSPVINKGVSVGLTTDYAGNPILGTPDIGAYEYQAKVVPVVIAGRTIPIP